MITLENNELHTLYGSIVSHMAILSPAVQSRLLTPTDSPGIHILEGLTYQDNFPGARLSCCLKHWHPVLECWFGSQLFCFWSLSMCVERQQNVPQGNMDGVLNSWLQHSPVLVAVTIWRLNRRFCLSPSVQVQPHNPGYSFKWMNKSLRREGERTFPKLPYVFSPAKEKRCCRHE